MSLSQVTLLLKTNVFWSLLNVQELLKRNLTEEQNTNSLTVGLG